MRSSSRSHERSPVRHRPPEFRTFSSDLDDPAIRGTAPPLSIPELEIGLRILRGSESKHKTFWDENIGPFRQTVLFAIRETSNALLSPKVPLSWRARLERELEELVQYIELADRYIARRFSCGRRIRGFPAPSPRVH